MHHVTSVEQFHQIQYTYLQLRVSIAKNHPLIQVWFVVSCVLVKLANKFFTTNAEFN